MADFDLSTIEESRQYLCCKYCKHSALYFEKSNDYGEVFVNDPSKLFCIVRRYQPIAVKPDTKCCARFKVGLLGPTYDDTIMECIDRQVESLKDRSSYVGAR